MTLRARHPVAVLLVILAAASAGAASASPYDARVNAARAELAARQGRPEAIAPLAELVRNADSLAPGALAPVWRGLVGDPSTDPLVAAQAAHHLALEDERAGRAALAESRWQGLGVVGAFWVVGPFDAQGRSGLSRAFGPEPGVPVPRAETRYPGKEREVGWRPASGAVKRGALSFDALLRPDSDAVAYALTYIESDRAQTVALRLGSPGPVKAWLDGRVVVERDVVRAPALDQDAVGVRLRRGVNVLLIKSVVTGGPWRLFVRLTDPSGRALRGVHASLDATGPTASGSARRSVSARASVSASASVSRKIPVRSLGAELRARAAAAGPATRAAAWLDYARFLTLSRAEDEDARALEAAVDEAIDAGAGAAAYTLLGEASSDDDKRRWALERAAATATSAAEKALALAALGEQAKLRRRDSAAAAHWREALAADPGCWPASLLLAAEEENAGLPAAAMARIDALPQIVRELPRVRRARVRALEALGRRGEAESERRALVTSRPADFDALSDLAAAVRARGGTAEALALYERAAVLRPDLVFVVMERAQLLEGTGARAEAREVLAAACARLPDEPRLHEALGKTLARGGELAAALAALGRALELRPQNPTLRRFVDRLQAELTPGASRVAAAEDLARAHAEDAEPLARAALAAAGKPASDPAVVLLDRQVVRVHGNGLSERFVQRVVHVRSERGVRDNQESYVRYTPGSQEVEIRGARIFRRMSTGDVEISEATARDDRDLSEPWYGLYYDNRAEVVMFEGLRAGDVVELQYTLADISSENAMADYFGDLDYIADTVPKRRWEYTLIGPAGRSFHFNQPRGVAVERTTDRAGAEVVHRFVARNVAKVEAEPSMPGWADVAPYLHVSTYESWQDVGRWYWNLARDQLIADEAVRKAAIEVTAGLTKEEDKIRALHVFVIEGTRYVGLELGIHGFKPYRVSQVLARRFGDCKDKASLLVALLREVGIDADLVLLRTRRGGRVDAQPASLAVFDHAIAYVPSRDLYLDGTAEFSGMSELPYEDQGVMVLRVGPRGTVLAETPVSPSAANRAARRWTADVEPSGQARVDETVTITGQAAPEWRQHYQTPGERQERYGKVWTGRYPGAAVETLSITGAEDRNAPVQVRASVSVPRLGDPAVEGRLSLPVTAREGELERSYARLSKRKQELLLAYPWQHEETLTFRIPKGWRIERAPQAVTREERFGRFSFVAEPSEGGKVITVHAVVDVTNNRIAAEDYERFRRFLGAVDSALGQRLVLRRGAP